MASSPVGISAQKDSMATPPTRYWGRPLTRLVPLDRSDEVPGIFDLVRQGRLVEHFETVRIRKDGLQIDVSLTISPIYDSQGRLIGVSTIARDIRQVKEAVEKLREEARRREQFLAMFSHELRNPLSAIRTADPCVDRSRRRCPAPTPRPAA